MKILLVYPYYGQRNLVTNFTLQLRKKGIDIDFLSYCDFAYSKSKNSNWSWWIVLCCDIIENTRGSFIGRCIYSLCSRLLKNRIIYSLLPLYDLIDFHAYILDYNKYITYCISRHIKFDITNWGSDVMRTTDEELSQQMIGYSNCRLIKSAENLQKRLMERTAEKYKYKMRTAYFGNSDFIQIDSINSNQVQTIKKQLLGEVANKFIFVCGYNGISQQNHFEIIDSLKLVQDKIADRIHLVFPMTYGANSTYIQKVKHELDNLCFSYTVLDVYLSNEEISVLRIISNIVVNIQDTDAMAGSLMDHLYCGSVCIIGNWLNYIPYDKNNIFYLKSSKSELSEKILDVVLHYHDYSDKCKNNHNKLNELFSWNSVIDNWANLYVE